MLTRKLFRQSLAPVVDLLYPPRCPVCGEAVGEHGGLCQSCWSGLVFPVAGEGEDTAQVSTATLYNDTSRKLVLAFKHGGRIALAGLLSRLMLARLPALEGDWLVVPVPLHRRRLWTRGYNQSALLAREIARAREHKLLVDALHRQRATPSLGGLGRAERARVLNGAIRANPRHLARLRGANILLVDDVMTSGATTASCCDALGQAGAAQVHIACFAQVMDEAL
ncbi:ComF family protein [Alteraurantiacibacter palmitatis]|uniref:ComF family protein n=1 Tax=Alteraurantiacibacter palmitatis TaxID=2054628 RepID=A0ABV7E187_9SPHN